MHALNTVIFQWTPPNLNSPVDVTIAFEYHWRYDAKCNSEYEWADPYIEAVYVGNVDIMPLLSFDLLNDIMRAYKGSKNEQY
jgi:hypothetical protein